jgi:hypothetical protein
MTLRHALPISRHANKHEVLPPCFLEPSFSRPSIPPFPCLHRPASPAPAPPACPPTHLFTRMPPPDARWVCAWIIYVLPPAIAFPVPILTASNLPWPEPLPGSCPLPNTGRRARFCWTGGTCALSTSGVRSFFKLRGTIVPQRHDSELFPTEEKIRYS